MANAKIVVTLGPAFTETPETCHIRAPDSRRQPIFSRLNSVSRNLEKHYRGAASRRYVKPNVRQAPPAAILLDFAGSENPSRAALRKGSARSRPARGFTITTDEIQWAMKNRASTIYASFAEDVRPGNTVLAGTMAR